MQPTDLVYKAITILLGPLYSKQVFFKAGIFGENQVISQITFKDPK